MSDSINDELLSAYLDGELTAEEQARVEQLLESSATARRQLDELRALSMSLQSLPQHRPPRDLSAAILARAATQAAGPKSPAPRSVEPLRDGHPGGGETTSLARRLFWPAMAVAAAILIALFNPRPPEGDLPPVAKSMPADKEDQEHDKERFSFKEKERDKDQPASGGKSALAEGSASPAADRKESDLAVTALKTGPAPTDALVISESEEKLAAKQDVPSEANRIVGAPGDNSLIGAAGENFGATSLNADGLNLAPAAAPAAKGVIGAIDALGDAAESEALMVVDVSITPEGARSGAFQQLLAKEDIGWQEAALEKRAEGERGRSDARDDRLKEEQVAKAAEVGKKQSPADAEPSKSKVGPADGVELIVVDAAPEQLHRALQQITEQKHMYCVNSVSDTAAPAAQQVTDWYRASQLQAASQLPVREKRADEAISLNGPLPRGPEAAAAQQRVPALGGQELNGQASSQLSQRGQAWRFTVPANELPTLQSPSADGARRQLSRSQTQLGGGQARALFLLRVANELPAKSAAAPAAAEPPAAEPKPATQQQ